MDFYIDIGAAVLLRLLNDGTTAPKYRRMFLKIFRAIVRQYEMDREFRQSVSLMHD